MMRNGLIAVFLGFLAVSAHAADRPSIVVFLADDLGWRDVSLHGGQNVPTPNMQRLAADGMTFTHAFVASPSCAPSRAALLTGLDPMRNGAMLNHARPKAEPKKWPAYFQDLGYEVVAIGKVAHYAQVTEYGFDHVSHYNYHQDKCVTEAVNWLTSRKNPNGKPLCLMVGTNWPHVPWPKKTTVDPAAIHLPPDQADTPETRTAWSRYLAAVANADRDLGLVYDAAQKILGPDTLFLFSSDHGAQVPFGKWNGYDSGMRTPLVAAWPGHIKPGSTSDAMVSWIDILPTCIDAAGGPPPDGISGRSFLGVLTGKSTTHRDEVYITHSGDGKMNEYPLRGVRTPDWKYIRNLNPTAEHHTHIDKGANPEADGPVYFRSWVAKAQTDPSVATLVSRYTTRPAEELYDLRTDPHEQHNLAADPAQATQLGTLRTKLNTWMDLQSDRGMDTERALPKPNAK
jgi:uncharacterized sulfatase